MLTTGQMPHARLAICAAVLIAGCGSTKTVTVTKSQTPPPAATARQTTPAATSSTPTVDPREKTACTAIVGDIPSLGSIDGIGQYGKDVAKLLPYVNGADQSTVISTMSVLEKLLGDIGSGRTPDPNVLGSLKKDAFRVGQICAGAIGSP